MSLGDDLFPWPRVAVSVTPEKVSHAVQQAVSRASLLNSQFEHEPNVVGEFHIIGRVVSAVDPAAAFHMAEIIATQLKAEPAIKKIDKKFLIGFVERAKLSNP